MPRKKSRTLTEVELEFMHVLWAADRELTTEDIAGELRRRGRELSGGSIRKMLSILMEKGYVSRRRLGRGFLYAAMVARRQATRSMVIDLLRRAFEGRGALLVGALMESRALTDEDLQEMEHLILAREREGA